MTGVPDPPTVAAAKAQAELDRLHDRVAAMRALLTQSLQDLVRTEIQLEHGPAALLEANERLVISAMESLSDVERANGERDEASRMGRLDPLTGLPNRTLLLDRLEQAISHAKRHGNRVALLFLDLNGFKQVNDVLGHAAGDRALQLITKCLNSLVRETDTVSRHGGDEFLILLAEVASVTDAARVAEKVNTALRKFRQIDNHDVNVTASIGISVYPDDGVDAKTLIDHADAAMYLAKKDVLGGFVLHADRPHLQSNPLSQPIGPLDARLTQHGSEMVEQELRHEQLREANAQLVLAALGAQELLAAAEEARRRQSQLLTLVANELKNPFAPIRLAAAALGRDGAERTLALQVRAIIEQQVDKMSRLVSELLDPHQPIKSLSPGRQIFEACEHISAAVEACRPAVERRRQTLEASIAPPLELSGEPASVTQIVMNLLTHASIHAGSDGWIRLGAQLVDGKFLLTVVHNRQRPHAAAAIFDPFVLQPHISGATDDGTGQRLQTVRELVDALGGNFIATMSDDGLETQLTVSLPV